MWKDTENIKRYAGGAWQSVWESYQFEFRKGDLYLSYDDTIGSSGGSITGSGKVRPATSGGGFEANFYVMFQPPVRLTAQNAIQCDVRLDGKDLLRFKLKAQYGNQSWTDVTFSPPVTDSSSYLGRAVWRTALATDISRLNFQISIEKFPVSTAYGGPIQFTISNMAINGGRCKFEEFSI